MRHGTYAGYIAEQKATKHGGPRPCADCVAAERAYQNSRKRARAYGRPLTIDATGVTRRLRALMALGWPQGELARRLGRSPSNVSITHNRYARVRADYANAVLALYEELRDTAGPSDRTYRWALKHHYAPPEAWPGSSIDDPDALPVPIEVDDVDPVAVELAITGQHVKLTEAERLEAVSCLVARGENKTEVGRRLRLSGQTVNQLLEQAGCVA